MESKLSHLALALSHTDSSKGTAELIQFGAGSGGLASEFFFSKMSCQPRLMSPICPIQLLTANYLTGFPHCTVAN